MVQYQPCPRGCVSLCVLGAKLSPPEILRLSQQYSTEEFIRKVFNWDFGQHYFGQHYLAHTLKISLAWVQEHFNERHINMKTANPMATYSTDLTPLDFMLWGYLKSKGYTGKPDTERSLK